MSVRTVAAAGTSFLVREQGDGDGVPVLLLHGVPETSSCWADLLPRLARGRRVLAPDLPGLGGSSYGGPYDVPSLVEQLAALVEAECPGGPVDVVGHDWGGSLALALAGARPELVRRLAVANAPYRSVPLHRAVHIPFFALPALPEALFRLGGRRVVRAMLQIGWRSARPLDAERRAEYEAAYTRPASVRAMLGYYRAATRPRLAAAVRRQSLPGRPRASAQRMLVLWGAQDPVLPVSTGESVVKDLGPDCVMVTVPGAGHFVVEEAPDVAGDVLVDFLAEAGQPAPAAPPQGPERHRVETAEPVESDATEVPSVAGVPVGGTPEEQAAAPAAKKAPARRAAAKRATATATRSPAPTKTPAAKRAPTAKRAPAKQAPAASSPPAVEAPPVARGVEKAPAVKKARAVEKAPAVEQSPVKKAPAAKKAPAVKKPPVAGAPAPRPVRPSEDPPSSGRR